MNAKRDLPHYAGGDRIAGKYQLLRPLGVGGMGVVWVAHNLVLDIHVAVKLIRRHLAGALATERLLREARSAARIAHPGIVRVFDFGTTVHGDPFIVMELLEGETLRDLLDREQRLTPLRAAATLLPIAGALASLEGTGIVHRDMKPDNVILVRADEDHVVPKLVDFGVAIVPGMERVTQGGLIVGTPDYLAPEQAAGEDIDHRADVWAFSVVLFEALTGQRPFVAEAVPDLLNAILLSPTPSIQDLGVHDPELDAIVARGLEKLRERRWSSMRSLAAALAAWARAHGLTEDITGAAVRDRLSDSSALPPAPAPAPAPTPTPTIGDSTTQLAARAGRTNRAHADPPSVAGLQVVADPEIVDDREPAAFHQPAPARRHDDLPVTVESAATRARRVEAEASRAPDLARAAPPSHPARSSPRAPLASSPPKPAEEPPPSPPSVSPASPEPRRNRSRAGLLVALLGLALAALALVAAGIGSGPPTSSGPLPGTAAASSSLAASSLHPGLSAPAATEPTPTPHTTSTLPPAIPGPANQPATTTATATTAATTSATPAAPSASTSARPAATAPDTRTDPARIDDLKDPYKPLKDPFKR